MRWEVCSIHRPAACCAWGERQPLLSAAGRVSYSALQMLGSAFTAEQAGQPPWAGPWACGGPSSFGASCVTAAGGAPAYLQPHLPGCGQAARPAHWAPSQACFPEPRGGSGSQVTVLVAGSSLNLGDCVDGRFPSPPWLCATCQAVTLTFSLCVSVR